MKFFGAFPPLPACISCSWPDEASLLLAYSCSSLVRSPFLFPGISYGGALHTTSIVVVVYNLPRRVQTVGS